MSHTVRIFTVQLAESHDHWSHPVSLLLAQGGQNNDVFLDSFLSLFCFSSLSFCC